MTGDLVSPLEIMRPRCRCVRSACAFDQCGKAHRADKRKIRLSNRTLTRDLQGWREIIAAARPPRPPINDNEQALFFRISGALGIAGCGHSALTKMALDLSMIKVRVSFGAGQLATSGDSTCTQNARKLFIFYH